MKLLVTGSNGLLGQKLIGLILDGGEQYQLLATSRGANRNLALPAENYQELDITNQDEVMQVVTAFKPEVIINTAAMTNVDQCEDEREGCWLLNVTAVEYLVAACREANARLVHLSTDFIFDGAAGPYTEDAEPNPVSYYGESKLASERVLMESDISWAIARTILVYGLVPNMSRSNIMLWVKESLEQGKHLRIVDDQWRTPTLAEDLAKGCLLIADKATTGVYHISGKNLLTPYEMAIETARFFNLDESLIEKVDGSTFTQKAKRPARTGFILDKARQDLGYEPGTFEEGLRLLKTQLEAQQEQQ